MTWHFYVLPPLFQSYQIDGKVLMKGSVAFMFEQNLTSDRTRTWNPMNKSQKHHLARRMLMTLRVVLGTPDWSPEGDGGTGNSADSQLAAVLSGSTLIGIWSDMSVPQLILGLILVHQWYSSYNKVKYIWWSFIV